MTDANHKKAAEHHEMAAKTHRMAAEHHTKGDHKAGLSRVLKDSQRIGKMIHSRSLIRELDDVWKISIGSGCGAAGSP